MLALDDPRWEETSHCYGSGKDVPKTLRNIETAKSLRKAFWDDFGNTLCHQCTIGTASIAAFPHLVRIAGDNFKNAKGFDSQIGLAHFDIHDRARKPDPKNGFVSQQALC